MNKNALSLCKACRLSFALAFLSSTNVEMLLPCELVGFSGNKTTKEIKENEARSCIEWKIEFDKVPKLPKEIFRIWNEHVN